MVLEIRFPILSVLKKRRRAINRINIYRPVCFSARRPFFMIKEDIEYVYV